MTWVWTFRPTSNLEGFVWNHQSITGLISQRQFAPKCWFLACWPLECCSFENILTNPTISQIDTLLSPYIISYYSPAITINSTTTTPKCTLQSVVSSCFIFCMVKRQSSRFCPAYYDSVYLNQIYVTQCRWWRLKCYLPNLMELMLTNCFCIEMVVENVKVHVVGMVTQLMRLLMFFQYDHCLLLIWDRRSSIVFVVFSFVESFRIGLHSQDCIFVSYLISYLPKY